MSFSVVQNYVRKQDHSKTNYNLVHETLQFLDCICGSTSGGLGLLGLYINESNVGLINQCLESLTEYCQGPCHENQVRDSDCVTFILGRVVWFVSITAVFRKAREVVTFLVALLTQQNLLGGRILFILS